MQNDGPNGPSPPTPAYPKNVTSMLRMSQKVSQMPATTHLHVWYSCSSLYLQFWKHAGEKQPRKSSEKGTEGLNSFQKSNG